MTSNKRGTEFRISFNCGNDAFDVNDQYINVVIPFDKEVAESRAKSRLALNDGDGTQLALILPSAKKSSKNS